MEKQMNMVSLQTVLVENSSHTETELRVLASIFALVKDMPGAPLNIPVVANGIRNVEEHELTLIFDNMIREGLLRKKYENMHVYCLTDKGVDRVTQAYLQQGI